MPPETLLQTELDMVEQQLRRAARIRRSRRPARRARRRRLPHQPVGEPRSRRPSVSDRHLDAGDVQHAAAASRRSDSRGDVDRQLLQAQIEQRKRRPRDEQVDSRQLEQRTRWRLARSRTRKPRIDKLGIPAVPAGHESRRSRPAGRCSRRQPLRDLPAARLDLRERDEAGSASNSAKNVPSNTNVDDRDQPHDSGRRARRWRRRRRHNGSGFESKTIVADAPAARSARVAHPPRFPQHPYPMDLERALSFSRYADARSPRRRRCATSSTRRSTRRFDWAGAATTLDAVANDGDAARAGRGAAHAAPTRVPAHARPRPDRRAPFAEVVPAITTLAERSLRRGRRRRMRAALAGAPRRCRCGDETAPPQQLIVIGMGKLGGGELNVSSDVDLVFVVSRGRRDRRRATDIESRILRPARPARSSPRSRTSTPDGYVFRVDMRLRPYGDSGPLERVVRRARAVSRHAGPRLGALCMAQGAAADRRAPRRAGRAVTPFVYRKYLDYDAYEGLRDIHRQIREQGKRRDYASDIKLGAGGIREIEFIVQALQIVRGGTRAGAAPARHAARAWRRWPRAASSRRMLPACCATATCSCAHSSIGCSIATTGRRSACPRMRRNAR